MNRVLYVIACAAPPAADVAQLVTLAIARGWDTCVLTTPYGRRFVDVAALEELTGHPVRSDYKNPGEPDVLPPADAVLVAPATVNTINKWAAGICDTLPLGILTEAIGKGLPVVAVPVSNAEHAAHPVFALNLSQLQSWGVTVLDQVLVAQRTAADDADDAAAADEAGPAAVAELDWPLALAAVEAAMRRQAVGASRRYEHPFQAEEFGPGVGPGLASVHDIGSAPSAGRDRSSGYPARRPGGRKPGSRHSRSRSSRPCPPTLGRPIFGQDGFEQSELRGFDQQGFDKSDFSQPGFRPGHTSQHNTGHPRSWGWSSAARQHRSSRTGPRPAGPGRTYLCQVH
jgi:hypothetical protein